MTTPSQHTPKRPSATQLALVEQYIGELSFLQNAPATVDRMATMRLEQMAEAIEALLTDCATTENADAGNEKTTSSHLSFKEAIAADSELAAAFNDSDAALRQQLHELTSQWDETTDTDTSHIIPLINQLHAFAVRACRFVENKLFEKNQIIFRRFAPGIIAAVAVLSGLLLFGALYTKYQPVTLSTPAEITLAGTVPGVTATFYDSLNFQTEITRQRVPSISFQTGQNVANPAIQKVPYSVQLQGTLTFTPQQLQRSELWYICVNHDDRMSLQINNQDVISDETGIHARTVCRRIRVTAAGAYPFTLKYATPDTGMKLSLLLGEKKQTITQIPTTAFLTAALEKQPVQDK